YKGLLLIFVTFGFGAFLLTLGVSTVFPLSLAIIVGVGAMSAMFDALQWTVLQANVPDEMRGRVIGAWIFAIGFGWMGHLAMGGMGQAFGARWALGVSGITLAALGIGLFAFGRRLRKA
ncbi:MAG: hypothetical protein HY682_08555, partial [Chloroflexi bacterium]|nr:hypothetical protein [Chloroflexota bacterium]